MRVMEVRLETLERQASLAQQFGNRQWLAESGERSGEPPIPFGGMDWPASLPCDLQERQSSEMLTDPVRDIPLNTDLTLLHHVEDVVEDSPMEITISAAELLLGPSEDN